MKGVRGNGERPKRCPRCGHSIAHSHNPTQSACPLCNSYWEKWELQSAPLPLPYIKDQIAAWLGELPHPSCIEILAAAGGLKVHLFAPPDEAQGAVHAWAALTQQQSRWRRAPYIKGREAVEWEGIYALKTPALLPTLASMDGDPFLAVGGRLLSLVYAARVGEGRRRSPVLSEVSLKLWILGKETKLQGRLRALAAYHYGSESGVEADTPNPWGLRLSLVRSGMVVGGVIAAFSGGAQSAGWLSLAAGGLGVLVGGLLFLGSFLGAMQWMRWRSTPREVVERCVNGSLLRVGITLQADEPQRIDLLAGESEWSPIARAWPEVQSFSMPLPAADLARLIAPPELGESSGVIDRDLRQDVPAPPPARTLVEAPFKIGVAVATAELVGINPDGHGMATGGSRTGKSSFVFRLLKQLIERGEGAPGIFLVDPHASLADGFLHVIDALPEALRGEAIRRLRVVTPDQPEVVPLNLLTLPDFSWAGNAIVQAGQRIWEDYWGPRMQAALLGLFRLAHAWNKNRPDQQMGLLHVVFAAFNTRWRHSAMAYLKPVDRMGALALDALLGQLSSEGGGWSQKWATEVISPVLSKAMALELSPWLFAAMHQKRFVDLESWIRERCWVVLRLPAGIMGREGSRLTAGIFYNVFDAAFRRATTTQPTPFYFVIDEAQEIAGGMRLEAMLSEGAKFGARMFVLAQSLSMLRRVEGFETVVQALLANTSTQAFFSPDPEDAELMRATLSASERYGATTLDIPSLQAWLRARLMGRWQPPTLVSIEPLPRADPARVQALIREVIAAHPEAYAPAMGWQEEVVRALGGIVPGSALPLLDQLLAPDPEIVPSQGEQETPAAQRDDQRRLGFG